jgi:hypothetical protein
MVFGAYTGVDPSSNTNQGASALTNLTNDSPSMGNFGSTNPWDLVDVNGFGYNDPLAGGTGMMDTGSSAWLLPFNIEPPNFGGIDDYGNTALDGMDFGDLSGAGVGSEAGGQFPEQNSNS